MQIEQVEERMQKSCSVLSEQLQKLRSGRAHPGMFDHLKVSAYGQEMQLSHLANCSLEDASSVIIQPWDASTLDAIFKAIKDANLDCNPVKEVNRIRIVLPIPSAERRNELIKQVSKEAEVAKVAVRNIRREANQEIRDQVKKKELSEDDAHQQEDIVQKKTDHFVNLIDELTTQKQKELNEF